MNITLACELMMKYNSCPKCGNEYIGDEEGTLLVEDDTFARSCKCGFEITITSEEAKELLGWNAESPEN